VLRVHDLINGNRSREPASCDCVDTKFFAKFGSLNQRLRKGAESKQTTFKKTQSIRVQGILQKKLIEGLCKQTEERSHLNEAAIDIYTRTRSNLDAYNQPQLDTVARFQHLVTKSVPNATLL